MRMQLKIKGFADRRSVSVYIHGFAADFLSLSSLFDFFFFFFFGWFKISPSFPFLVHMILARVSGVSCRELLKDSSEAADTNETVLIGPFARHPLGVCKVNQLHRIHLGEDDFVILIVLIVETDTAINP